MTREEMLRRWWSRAEKYVEPEPNSGCWLWSGGLTAEGYASTSIDHRSLMAHRLSYEHHVGPIPPKLHLDHLCRMRACVNPAHLDPVTSFVNWTRGEHPCAKVHRTNVCRRGHPYDEVNTLRIGNARRCRECARESTRRWRRTHREAA